MPHFPEKPTFGRRPAYRNTLHTQELNAEFSLMGPSPAHLPDTAMAPLGTATQLSLNES